MLKLLRVKGLLLTAGARASRAALSLGGALFLILPPAPGELVMSEVKTHAYTTTERSREEPSRGSVGSGDAACLGM